uniref:Disease resistance protein RPM1-like n=1 Tax=Elaeis guineensis var. tenera TaxID=51953 RepID=A0A8N4IHI0_ELAGV|nr:disease resistance protein RPM1-like [Elaeis guineensis]
MAGGALQFALQKLDSLLVKEQQLLRRVDTGVKDIREELECIKSFLREADAREDRDGMKTWVNQVREIAYDIEDVLDEFMLHFDQPHGHGFASFLHRGVHYIKHLGTRRRIATAIQEIKIQVHNISQRKDMYTIKFIDNGTSNAATNRLHDRHMAALFIEEAELVGFEKPKEELIGWLVKGESQRKVISVVGMGGLGKTTLVRKVYDHERVKGWFSCHAWITVTQLFTIDELLRSIINQFCKERNELFPGRIDAIEGIQLIETLCHFLRDKGYVVVLDYLWHIQEWDHLKYALPDNDCGSRVLVTTRITDVGLSCLETCGHVYNLEPLPPVKAWSLLCKKVFRSTPRGACPPELEDIFRDIVKICDGLPLAIVEIAGLLSKRVIFPKDYPVKCITLIRLWMAKGFIESEEGETMEKVAVDYLNDLIDRNMVQVADYYDYGRIRSCQVHDLIHEIVLLKSKEENFSTSLFRKKTHIHGRIRRLSIHNTGKDVLQDTSLSHLRALFMFGVNALSFSSMCNLFYSFRLLKVLDLEGAPIERFPIEFRKLLHLRYLSLQNTRINKLSKSLGKLENLETLDLKGTYVSELLTKILKLQSLCHLLAYHYYTGRHPPFHYTNGVKVPQGIGRLRDLQKLTYIEANQDSGIVRELRYLTQLRRLGIVKLRTEDGISLCASIERMNKLRSISVTSIGMDEFLDLQYLKSPPSDLQHLYLRGPLQTLADSISTLQNLVRMRLRRSKLKEDSLGVLQALPNLVELTLIRAYDGVKLCCQKGGFQKLKILDLEQLDNLNYAILDGAMPNLQKMYIRHCVQLKVVPLGIEQLINLKELHLVDMPEVFVQRLRRHGGGDRPKVKHIPVYIPVVRSYDHEDRAYEEL